MATITSPGFIGPTPAEMEAQRRQAFQQNLQQGAALAQQAQQIQMKDFQDRMTKLLADPSVQQYGLGNVLKDNPGLVKSYMGDRMFNQIAGNPGILGRLLGQKPGANVPTEITGSLDQIMDTAAAQQLLGRVGAVGGGPPAPSADAILASYAPPRTAAPPTAAPASVPTGALPGQAARTPMGTVQLGEALTAEGTPAGRPVAASIGVAPLTPAQAIAAGSDPESAGFQGVVGATTAESANANIDAQVAKWGYDTADPTKSRGGSPIPLASIRAIYSGTSDPVAKMAAAKVLAANGEPGVLYSPVSTSPVGGAGAPVGANPATPAPASAAPAPAASPADEAQLRAFVDWTRATGKILPGGAFTRPGSSYSSEELQKFVAPARRTGAWADFEKSGSAVSTSAPVAGTPATPAATATPRTPEDALLSELYQFKSSGTISSMDPVRRKEAEALLATKVSDARLEAARTWRTDPKFKDDVNKGFYDSAAAILQRTDPGFGALEDHPALAKVYINIDKINADKVRAETRRLGDMTRMEQQELNWKLSASAASGYIEAMKLRSESVKSLSDLMDAQYGEQIKSMAAKGMKPDQIQAELAKDPTFTSLRSKFMEATTAGLQDGSYLKESVMSTGGFLGLFANQFRVPVIESGMGVPGAASPDAGIPDWAASYL